MVSPLPLCKGPEDVLKIKDLGRARLFSWSIVRPRGAVLIGNVAASTSSPFPANQPPMFAALINAFYLSNLK